MKSILTLGFVLTVGSASVMAAPTTTVTVGGHTILADRNGLTAYTFAPDSIGVSNCNGGCAREWPPITALPGEAVEAPFATLMRADGTLQITFNGHPIYRYIDDEKSGDTLGDGLGGIWHVVPVGP